MPHPLCTQWVWQLATKIEIIYTTMSYCTACTVLGVGRSGFCMEVQSHGDMDFSDARPTLNDILLQHKLEKEHLHKECSPDIMLIIVEESVNGA